MGSAGTSRPICCPSGERCGCAKSPKMAACELLLALASYNLIRAVMAEAARQINGAANQCRAGRSQFLAIALRLPGLRTRCRPYRFRSGIRPALATPDSHHWSKQTLQAQTPGRPGGKSGPNDRTSPTGRSGNERFQKVCVIGRFRLSLTVFLKKMSNCPDAIEIIPDIVLLIR